MAERFLTEMHGSVSQRMLRYDTAAAAESTHQSRQDYFRRKEGVLARPSWAQHAASSVADAEKMRELQQRQLSLSRVGSAAAASSVVTPARTVLYRQKPAPSLSEKLLSEQRARAATPASRDQQLKSPLVSAERAITAADDKRHHHHNDHHDDEHRSNSATDDEETVVLWTHNGREKLPVSKVPGHVSTSRSRSDASGTGLSTATHAMSVSAFRGGPRRREPPPSQPVSVGDLLGKNLNITHAQKVQRARYEKLEQQRLDAIKRDLEEHGWSAEVRPGGPDKRLSRRIYAGLPKEMPEAAQEIFEKLRNERKKSPLSKRD